MLSLLRFAPRFAVLFTTIVAVVVAGGCGQPEPDAPNIIFIFSDDHSSAAISAYGSVVNRTPNIDRLASEGLRFDRCLVTNSICAPSRATILTGKYSHLNGQLTNAERFDGSQQTFPKLLQQAGYQTALVGKWHLKSDPTGFDFWRALIGQGPYYNPPIGSPEDTTVHEGYTTDVITDIALNWLQSERDPRRPFMLMYQHKAPHRPWDPGPDHLDTFDDVEIPVPETFDDDYVGRSRAAREANMRITTNLRARDLKIEGPNNLTADQQLAWDNAYGPKNDALRASGLQGDELDDWKYQRYVKDYLRAVTSLDDNIGRVLDYLDQSGLADNTVVFYSSDQGWYLGEHGWYDKRWMFEPSLRTPLLVRWPGSTSAGSNTQAMASNLDLAPTFLEIAGVTIPPDMQGISLVPLFRGDQPDEWRSSFYYQYYEYPGSHCVQRHYGVRTDRYKLIYYYMIDEWELFDLESDPNELTSVYDDASYRAVVDELELELGRLRLEYEVSDDTRPMGDCNSDVEGWFGFTDE